MLAAGSGACLACLAGAACGAAPRLTPAAPGPPCRRADPAAERTIGERAVFEPDPQGNLGRWQATVLAGHSKLAEAIQADTAAITHWQKHQQPLPL